MQDHLQPPPPLMHAEHRQPPTPPPLHYTRAEQQRRDRDRGTGGETGGWLPRAGRVHDRVRSDRGARWSRAPGTSTSSATQPAPGPLYKPLPDHKEVSCCLAARAGCFLFRWFDALGPPQPIGTTCSTSCIHSETPTAIKAIPVVPIERTQAPMRYLLCL